MTTNKFDYSKHIKGEKLKCIVRIKPPTNF
jgi:hypothetical protein